MTISIGRHLAEFKCQWLQFFGKYNWYTFQFLNIEFEYDKMTFGYEFLLTILGFSFRYRYNTDKAIEQFKEFEKDIEHSKKETKHTKYAEELWDFMWENTELRFWQGLLDFINKDEKIADKILIEKDGKTTDTFYI